MQWKSTGNTLFYVILKAPAEPEKQGLQVASSLFSKAATSPEHDGAQKQMPGSKFNPTPGFIRIDPSAIFSFLTF